MFSGYSEVMAYIHEEIPVEIGVPVVLIEDDEHDFIRAELLPLTSAFGGFKLWPTLKTDFILIAECSEISGPNPIYTFPPNQRIISDLNLLCIRILSADYQEFSCNKSVTNNHTQVLMPDIMSDIHVAINHFTLYDSEARGFVRPLCLAYVTTDKHKLIQMSLKIFKCLSDAASLIQMVNRKHCQEGFCNLGLDLQLTKSNLSQCEGLQNDCQNPEERLKVYHKLIDSCMDAIQQILDSCKESETKKDAKLIEDFHQRLNRLISCDILTTPVASKEKEPHEPRLLKVPIQQNFDKRLRSLFTISPIGSLLALYHLYLTQRYFRQKYENIVLCDDSKLNNSSVCGLQYGACLRLVICARDIQEEKKCCIRISSGATILNVYDENYLLNLEGDFSEAVFDFLKNQNVPLSNGISDTNEQIDSDNAYGLSDAEEASENAVEDSIEMSVVEQNKFSQCLRHVVTLGGIWEVIDSLRFQFPDIESVTLKVLRALNVAENIFLSLLSRTLIVILYSVEEEFFIRIFIQVLAAIVPRGTKKEVSVVHHRGKPIKKCDFSDTAVVTYSMPCELSEVIPAEIMESTLVLDLTTSSYTGPKYQGCLLEGVNERIKMMNNNDPVLPFLVSVLSDVELQVNFWQSVVKSSATNDFSTVYLLQKGYTRFDIRIVETLSKIQNGM